MTAVGLEITTRCRSCGNVVAVNAFVREIACGACDRRLPLDEIRWQLLVSDVAQEAHSMPPQTERSGPLTTEDGIFQRVYRRADPTCTACGTSIAPDRLRAMAARGSGFCPSCAAPVGVRASPPLLAQMGIVALVAEDRVQLAGPDAPSTNETVPLACATCGGALRIDGTQRVVPCPWCRGTQFVPDDVWRRLHPSRPVVRWSLVFAEVGAGAAPALALARWEDLCDVVADGWGNLYCAGTVADAQGSDAFSVWSMTPDLRLRWLRSGLKFDDWHAQLALAPSGHVVLWQQDKRTVHVLSCVDGQTAVKLSGKANEGRALEMEDCDGLLVDADGTILMIAKGYRLLRYSAYGDPIATWGDGARERRPDEDEDAHIVERIRGRPLFLMAAKMGLGWDGFLYFHQMSGSDGMVVARYDRRGSQQWRSQIVTPKELSARGRPIADARGVCHVYVENEGHGGEEIWRLSPDGRQAQPFIVPAKVGGLLGSEKKMAVLPDGTVWMLGDRGAARRFGPDGRVQLITDASRTADQAVIDEDDDD